MAAEIENVLVEAASALGGGITSAVLAALLRRGATGTTYEEHLRDVLPARLGSEIETQFAEEALERARALRDR